MNRPTPTRSVAISVRAQPSAGDGPGLIIAGAVAELLARYGSLSPYELVLDRSTFDPPRGAFLVARASGIGDPVGGVGVRGIRPKGDMSGDWGGRDGGGEDGHGWGGWGGWDGGDGGGPSTAEVRRLWVDPAWRGRVSPVV